jgi:hypothetical protein
MFFFVLDVLVLAIKMAPTYFLEVQWRQEGAHNQEGARFRRLLGEITVFLNFPWYLIFTKRN